MYRVHQMRLGTFDNDGETWTGALVSDNTVVNLAEAGKQAEIDLPRKTVNLFSRTDWEQKVTDAVSYSKDHGVGQYDQTELDQLAPVTRPEKIIGVGLNYQDHADETGMETPDSPILFAKFPTAITGPGTEITWSETLTSEVDYEAELVAVIGKRGRNIPVSEAEEYIAGYTVGNDVSARDLQFKDDQWVRGKSLDTFAPLGPDIVPSSELDDPHDLRIWTDVNGKRVQDSTTEELIFSVPELVSFCSEAFTLTPGDLIFTGTPFGAGYFRDPKVLLGNGDTVTVGVEGIGELTNTCRTV